MKRFLLFYAVIFSCVFYQGCTREQEYAANDDPQQQIGLNDEALSVLGLYSDGDFEIPEQEAIEMAKAAITDPSLNPGTRTETETPVIKNVRPLTSDNFIVGTKPQVQYVKPGTGQLVSVELPKVLGYAVNFSSATQQDAGFVLVPADKRISHTILATVPAGCLPVAADEEITNDGLAFFLDNAEEYAAWRIVEAERQIDSVKSALIAQYQPQFPGAVFDFNFNDSDADTRAGLTLSFSVVTTVEKDWHDVGRIGPLLPVEWGQGEPFNDLVKNKSKCGSVVTGCVPTAAAQLMAYWKYPPVVGGEPMDWDNMVKYTGNDAWNYWEKRINNKWLGTTAKADPEIRRKTAYLMKYMGESIGAEYHCSTEGGCKICGGGGTSASERNVIDRLNHMGYHTGTSSGYNFKKIKASLQAGKPVMIGGYSKKIKHSIFGFITWSTYKGGHEWIIDGYEERQRTLKTVTTIRFRNKILSKTTSYRTEKDDLIQNNWGWSGISNGYFTAGVFDSNNRIYGPDNTLQTRGTDKYYRYDIELWCNIHR